MRNQLLVIVVILATAIKVNNAEAECKLMPACRRKNTPVYTQHYPHESDPHKFYKCLGTYGCIMECPMYNNERMVYYQQDQWCDCEVRPCKEDSGNVTPTPTPTPNPGTCEEGKFYKHEDRHKFYECVNGKLVERRCLQGHCFNPIVSQCDLMSCD